MSGPKAPVNSVIEAIPVPRNTALVLARALKVLAVPCNHPLHECQHSDECSHDLASAVVNELRAPRYIVRASEPAAE